MVVVIVVVVSSFSRSLVMTTTMGSLHLLFMIGLDTTTVIIVVDILDGAFPFLALAAALLFPIRSMMMVMTPRILGMTYLGGTIVGCG